MNTNCPRCGYARYWNVRRGKFKCAACKYEWTPYKLPLRLTETEWRKILMNFILGLSSNKIASEIGLEKRMVHRALNKTREVMLKNIPNDLNVLANIYATFGQKNRQKMVDELLERIESIKGYEGFRGYFKRSLPPKSRIRRERLPLYIAEYIWRFEHHNYSTNEQLEILLNLLSKKTGG